MGQKKVSNFSMMKMLLLFGLIPMVCTALIIVIISLVDTGNTVKENVHSELAIANEEFNMYAEERYADLFASGSDIEKDYARCPPSRMMRANARRERRHQTR